MLPLPESEVLIVFGQRLKALRKQRGLSQEALASACMLDRTYVGGVERGERNVSLINIVRLSTALEIPASALFDRFR